jgi:hypothetical protein
VKRLLCRVWNNHKWVRMETSAEEAYYCRRCGKRHFGKLREADLRAFTGGAVRPVRVKKQERALAAPKAS